MLSQLEDRTDNFIGTVGIFWGLDRKVVSLRQLFLLPCLRSHRPVPPVPFKVYGGVEPLSLAETEAGKEGLGQRAQPVKVAVDEGLELRPIKQVRVGEGTLDYQFEIPIELVLEQIHWLFLKSGILLLLLLFLVLFSLLLA